MNKRTTKIVLLCIAFTLLILNVFAQTTPVLHAVVKGSGKQSVVLIPGFSCSGKVWDETVNQLSARYTCHIITFPGFGGEPTQGEADLKQWETAVADYITTHKLQQPVVIGHSMGGGMAMALAADYPTLLSRIVVVDALPCLAALFNPAFTEQPAVDCTPFEKQFTSMTDDQLYKMQQHTMPRLLADTTMQETAIQWTMHSDRKTLGRIYCQFSNTDLRARLANVQCPALILLEANFKNSDANIQAQFAQLQHKTIAYANKGLHFIMYDDKDWFFQQLNAYLH